MTNQDIIDMTEGLRRCREKDWRSYPILGVDDRIIEDWLAEEDTKLVARKNKVSSIYVYELITKNGLI